MYTIYIRDANFNRVGEITDFNKLELVPRFNNVGSFVLDLPTNTRAAKELIKPKSGIIVKRDGRTTFSGTVTSRSRSFGNQDVMTFSGKDDNVYLARTLAYPVPGGNFSLSDYDVRTGKAETIMKQYVDYNCGLSALPERRLLTLAPDTGLGNTITGRARFHSLLELLQSLALNGGGLGFNVVQVGNALEFQVYMPGDKTRTALFSPLLGNLSSFDYSSEDPESNFVIVGGGGEGAERILLQKSDNTSVTNFGRIETFIDQRNMSDTVELNQSLDEELASKAEKVSLNFTPVDTPQLSFGRDYGLGDKVTIVLTQPNEVISVETIYYFISAYQTVDVTSENVRKIQQKLQVVQDVVREVKISIDSNGETIVPFIGTEDSLSKDVPKIFNDMKKTKKRISNLERR
jgi:hypothetical protein